MARCCSALHVHACLQETLARLWAQREMEGELRAKAATLVSEWAQSGKPQGPLGRPLQAAIKLAMA